MHTTFMMILLILIQIKIDENSYKSIFIYCNISIFPCNIAIDIYNFFLTAQNLKLFG